MPADVQQAVEAVRHLTVQVNVPSGAPTSAQIALALMPVAVAVGALVVGYHQFRIAEANLRLALFEKRFAVYQAALKYVRNVTANAGGSVSSQVEFSSIALDAAFLFDADATRYFEEILGRGARLLGIARSNDEQNPGLAQERYDHLVWMADQALELPKRLRPYMEFAEWRLRRPWYLRMFSRTARWSRGNR